MKDKSIKKYLYKNYQNMILQFYTNVIKLYLRGHHVCSTTVYLPYLKYLKYQDYDKTISMLYL